jgi:NAD(P)-dependent dehydrogenase (short-subunit alcohol dehydrogenase family)
LVTGGSSGIGLATARRFIAEGAFVYLTGRRKAALDTAVSALGSQAAGVCGDVARNHDLDALFERIAMEHGRLDIVFANAAAMATASIGEIDEAHIEAVLGPNLRGVIFTVQKALPLMPTGGSIVLNGSLGASRGWPEQGVYAASKAAVRSLARTWTTELAPRDIRVNVVSPGPTATGDVVEAHHAALAELVPARRLARADEIASAVAFLASSDASYVRGAELFADGGFGQV